MSKKILIPTKLDKKAAELLTARGFTVVQDADRPIAELAAAHPDAAALVVRSEKVGREIIDSLPSLRLVVRAGAGYDTIDIKHARRKGVDVMNTPGANSNAVAEEVVAMWLAVYRHVVPGDVSTRAGKWEKSKFMGRELAGKTIGIVGLGNIGRLVARRLQGFEVKCLAYDPMVSADLAEKLGVRLCPLDEVFAKSDCVTLHIPETDQTRGFVGERLLSLMRPGAVLVNCARSGVVDEAALRAAKKAKPLLYCTDVYPEDAPGPKTVADIADLMLPHVGANTFEANANAAMRAAEQTVDYFEKGVTSCVVNKALPDGLDPRHQSLANALARLASAYLGNKAPMEIQTSFYGRLGAYSQWMTAPIVAGICPEFDPFLDAADAEAFLAGRGISLKNREVDNSKDYGDAMTIDLFEGVESITKASVRGTIAESSLMVSRLNNFDKLYLDLSGHNLFVEYADQPGVLAKITSALGAEGINIVDIRAPQDAERRNALTVVRTESQVPPKLVADIGRLVGAKACFRISF